LGYDAKTDKDLGEMSLEELQQFGGMITDDVFDVLTLEGSVSARDHLGGLRRIKCVQRLSVLLKSWRCFNRRVDTAHHTL
jgi:argininosuccinate lyase